MAGHPAAGRRRAEHTLEGDRMTSTAHRHLPFWAPATTIATTLLTLLGVVACGDKGKAAAPVAPPTSVATAGLTNCPPPLPMNIHQISVSTGASGPEATLKINDPRNVPPTGAGLRWKLNTNGYTFTGNGIVIASPPASAASSSTGTEFQWCFGTTTAGTQWKYTINFYADAAPSVVFVCDPTIISTDSSLSTDALTTLTCPARP